MKSKIKVLHIITRFIGGGAEQDTKLIMEGLKDKYNITFGFANEYEDR